MTKIAAETAIVPMSSVKTTFGMQSARCMTIFCLFAIRCCDR
jgi:hypothetical protein